MRRLGSPDESTSQPIRALHAPTLRPPARQPILTPEPGGPPVRPPARNHQPKLGGVTVSTGVLRTEAACRGGRPTVSKSGRRNTAANDSNYGRLAAVA